MASADCAELSVSVSIEDVAPADWTEKVYLPDIVGKPTQLFKKPGYNLL
jgi:4-oxalocrotonate tautomerase